MHRTQQIARAALVLCLSTILWLALSPNPPNPAGLFDFDKVNHVLAFFVLAGLLDYASVNIAGFEGKVLPLLAFGFLIEVLQYWVGYRYFEWGDFIADGFGVAGYAVFRRYLRPPIDRVCLKYIR